jgi:hypothetical protein
MSSRVLLRNQIVANEAAQFLGNFSLNVIVNGLA